jgi:adenylate kinase
MNIILLGPQGSGKGTQGQRLAQKYNHYYFSTGEELRRIAKTDPRINETIHKVGALLPDDEVFNITSKVLTAKATNNFKDIIFDGYPRSVPQYRLLHDFLSGKFAKIDKVILLEISDKESIKRLTSRRTHKLTGKIYNLETNPPGPEIRPEDLYQRLDDHPEAISKRLSEYKNSTHPLIKLLTEENKVLKVNAAQSIDRVTEDIEKVLNLA